MKSKICKGCFQEWDEEWEHCPVCGFSFEEENDPKEERQEGEWLRGDIIGKRFMIGSLFFERKNLRIWRAYDAVLEIKCFLFTVRKAYARSLLLVADIIRQKQETIAQKVLQYADYDEYKILEVSYQTEEDAKESLELIKHMTQQEVKIQPVIQTMHYEEAKQVLPTDTFLEERYRVIGPLGIGGFGITYLCEDINLGRNVAIKEYFPSEWAQREDRFVTVKSSAMIEPYRFGMDSFRKEAKMTAKFIHEKGIVTAYDYFEENDTAYLVMEYISGTSIGKKMKAKGQALSPERVCEILLPVLDSLDKLHDRKIVHSDISPGNIMETKEGREVLIDLGAAKYWYDTRPNLAAAFLKPDFAAPEQYRTAKLGVPKDEGAWTDIYALGAMMYYMLTGHKPPDVITRLESDSIKLLPFRKYKVHIKKKWFRIVEQCMDVDFHNRYRSVTELKKALIEAL